ncbi:MAG TPA: protein-L-isoaspartate(D-aspartate) O-methyltransferase [Candidatus Deferrimicrobium sp.]|nr:protein-L-isoaspartate(D-aspartate) O-methyltransferase [Candidatus Deferrimicrobium sp.]
MFGWGKSESEAINFISQRLRMVDEQLVRRGVHDATVLAAMRTVPRHRFVTESYLAEAYSDGPLPIGHGQTISQPYVVASMTENLELDRRSKVLEIGTGSGYQTAILAEVAGKVFSIEVIPELFEQARRLLAELEYGGVEMRLGDGSLGWPEAAPFDAILVTAAAPKIPESLVEQLVEGGRMVLPLAVGGSGRQDLIKIRKRKEGIESQTLYEVRFVPMVGKVED